MYQKVEREIESRKKKKEIYPVNQVHALFEDINTQVLHLLFGGERSVKLALYGREIVQDCVCHEIEELSLSLCMCMSLLSGRPSLKF